MSAPRSNLLDKLGDPAIWRLMGIGDPTATAEGARESNNGDEQASSNRRSKADASSFDYHSLIRNQKLIERQLRFWLTAEVSWLMNTINLEAARDLTPYPQVRTSVLNYGVADLAGKMRGQLAFNARKRKIEEAILLFEPRLSAESLTVEMRSESERENAVTYVISADITGAVEALPIRFITDVEADTGAATVRT